MEKEISSKLRIQRVIKKFLNWLYLFLFRTDFLIRGCSAVVARSLCMWKAPGSIPGISSGNFFSFSLFSKILIIVFSNLGLATYLHFFLYALVWLPTYINISDDWICYLTKQRGFIVLHSAVEQFPIFLKREKEFSNFSEHKLICEE